MNLILNYAIPHPITADDIRSLWQVLAEPTVASFQLTNLPQNRFVAADNAVLGQSIYFNIFYKKNVFPIEFKLTTLDKKGKLVSILFLNPSQNNQLLGAKLSSIFFKWVLKTLHTGGKMLQAKIAFLSSEKQPNEYIKLSLKNTAFTLEQYPLMCWINGITIPEQLLKETKFNTLRQNDGSIFLLPPDFQESLMSLPSKKAITLSSETNTKYITKAEIFAAMPSPSFRRETIRWVIHDYTEANQNIINLLKKGLIDPDWEVRMSSVIACARYKLDKLLPLVKEVKVPTTGKSGLNTEERNILGGIKNATIAILKGVSVPMPTTNPVSTREDKRNYLLSVVAGEKVIQYNNALMLVIALTAPHYPTILPEKLPDYVVQKNGKLYLKNSTIQLSWISGFSHWVGSDYHSYHPIQLTKLKDGGFISTYPIKSKQFNSSSIKENQEGSVLCHLTQANNFCQKLSQKQGFDIILPNSLIWEIGARGHNGRLYPWGLSYDKGTPNLSSPWGLYQTVGFGGEWTKSITKNNQNIIMGHSKFLRCYEMAFAQKNNHFSFRIFINQ